MARTASTGFFFRKSLSGRDLPEVLQYRAGNSATLKVGDAVRLNTSGFVVRATTSQNVLGFVSGLVNNNGVNPFSLGADTAGATLTPGDQLTTKATNTTDATYINCEVVFALGDQLWYNLASAALTQAMVGQLFNTTTGGANQIDQTSNNESSGQYQLISLDPDGDGNTSKGLFRVFQGQLGFALGNATAIRVA